MQPLAYFLNVELPIRAPNPHHPTPPYSVETKSLSYNLPPTGGKNFIWPDDGVSGTTTSRAILNDVTCKASPGEILAIVGPSGAGKTTLLSLFAGMIHPSKVSGAILVNGRPMDLSTFRRLSGHVTQEDALFPLLTVEESLVYSARLRLGATTREAEARVRELIKELGLDRAAGTMAAAFSGGSVPPQVVEVMRNRLAACLTCPLCHKLFREATTISECLHTFCGKCIYEKLVDEEVDCCPICNIDLGVLPVEKLRPDHNLQDLRAKLFPFKKRKFEATEDVAPINLPVRRKERSLSSLVVNTPRVAAHTSLTGRRTKGVTRKASALRGLSPTTREVTKKEEDTTDDLAENSSLADNLIKLSQNKRQTSSNTELPNNTPNKDRKNGLVDTDSFQDKAELWKPLNCLVEAANRTKSYKSNPTSIVVKAEQFNGVDGEVTSNKARAKEHPNKSKCHDQSNDNGPSPLVTGKAKRLKSRKRKDLATSTHMLLDAASSQCDKRINPIWFSLVASLKQDGDPPLPQIPTSYLRIKDGSVPVSFIQKYLVAKLNLANENEVEIICRGQTVKPELSLRSVVDQWIREESAQKLQATIGTSAKEFVMVLSYGRRKDP